MTNFRVDPDALRATRAEFVSVADQITSAAQKLRQVIEAEGECWGSDKIGQSFAKNYTPGVPKALTGVDGLSKAMSTLGDKMVATANELQNRDQINAAQLNQNNP
ncbi:WXG100 family type VII secretion target [Nocardia brasiliensis]|uniref:WXG100 family type VII secretion target n=1 Tax=Nocardia brasiliensis TaxID=37326 RepID=UPI0018955CFB|nr:WXG100 family type VII secretion target [Nocardia brasiliensis]MBF6126961.1 WXG100 family type VII secretion target [Nocardia brasiliensis]